jgi:flagellar hook-associated protein 2
MTSTFAVDGLISGLQTRQIVAQLMALERRPLTLLQGRQTAQATRLTALQNVKSQISSLLDAINNLTKPNALNTKSATVDAASYSSGVLNVTVGPDATPGTFRVTVNQIATPTRVNSSGPIGQAINRSAPLASAGFRVAPITTVNGNPATFSINGRVISIDITTTLDDVITRINSSGAGVTASLVADASGRANNAVQLISAPGQAIQLGSGADTSNLLSVLNLTGAASQPNTVASVQSGQAARGTLSTAITINGVTTVINQTSSSFKEKDNAAFIVNAINNTPNSTVLATDNGDGTFWLQQKTAGTQAAISITTPGTGTGLIASTTRNGTDKIVSTLGLGAADITKVLASSRLQTPIATGGGTFTINGVQISYTDSDSISSIITRINNSTAGVTASYDSVADQLKLTALQNGSQSISLADNTGNFLGATRVLLASQSLGQQAIYSIDTVNGGQPLTSNSNTITGVLPGVTLELKTPGATPVTVTVAHDTSSIVTLVRQFVDAANKVLDTIDTQTKWDPTTKTGGPLAGDSGVLNLERRLRSLVSSIAVGSTGKYRSLADIGITTGAFGTAVGSANRLILDETKLNAALADNDAAVQSILAGFSGTLGTPTGPGNVASVSGIPLNQHESGTYYVKVLDTSGNVEVRFVNSAGIQTMKKTGRIPPGTGDSALIPGLRIDMKSTIQVGEDSFALTVTARGVPIPLSDYLKSVLDSNGFFATRESSAQSVSRDLARRIDRMQDRLKDREAALLSQFSTLEQTLARLRGQSDGVLGALSGLALPTAQTSSSAGR